MPRLDGLESGLGLLVARVAGALLFLPCRAANVTIMVSELARLARRSSARTCMTADRASMSFRGYTPHYLLMRLTAILRTG